MKNINDRYKRRKTFKLVYRYNISTDLTNEIFMNIEVCPEDIQDIKALYGIDLPEEVKKLCSTYGFYIEALRQKKTKDELIFKEK